MSASPCPPLPTEIWIRVLQSLHADEDLPFLWITCRHVSSTFRDATESIFRERFLPKLRLDFQLGQFYPPNDGHFDDCPYPLNCEFEFERLSEDKETAILSMDKDIPEDLTALCQKRMRDFVSRIEIPEQIVQIRRDINDGPVPGLKFDPKTSELSCDWREVFTVFYGEEFLYRKLLDDAISRRKPLLDALKVKVDKKEMGPEDVIMRALKAFADDNSAARKTARRARIKRQFQLLDGTEWDFGRDGDSSEEGKALKAIQQARQFASFETWSDDDSEDEEDDDGTDSQEEWETEDDDEWADGSAKSID